MPVYDSSGDFGSDHEEQECTLAEFASIGGDRAGLEATLKRSGEIAVRLRREHEALFEYFAARDSERSLLARSSRLRKVKVACEHVPLAVPADILAEEARLKAALQNTRLWLTAVDPSVLAQQRRATAKPSERHLHHQIAAPKLRTIPLRHLTLDGVHLVGLPEVIAPIRKEGRLPEGDALDYGSIDESIRAIRRAFIPDVIRNIFRVISRVGPAIRQRERQQFFSRYGCAPTGAAELKHIEDRVAAALHALTARVIKAFYPTWAALVSPRSVRMILENARKRTRVRHLSG
jgi:hypothetical protein